MTTAAGNPETTISIDSIPNRMWNVVIIGAGPAGAMAALQLRRDGIANVLLIDRMHFPRPKVCGSCLNRPALATLEKAGLRSCLEECGAPLLRRFVLASGGSRATMALRAEARAISRETLDAALVAKAIEAGAEFAPEVHAKVAPFSPGSATPYRTVELRPTVNPGARRNALARIVLVASGLGAGAIKSDPITAATIARRSYIGAGAILENPSPHGWSQGALSMAVGRGGYVGVVRLEDGRLNVAAAIDPALARSSGGFGAAAAGILESAGFPSIDGIESLKWRGVPHLTQRPRRVAAERLFLIGDAAGYVEPFTGEGIGWALQSGIAVAPIAAAACACDLWRSDYACAWWRAHRRAVGLRQRGCRALALALRTPPQLIRFVVAGLAIAPEMASPIIARLNRVGPFRSAERSASA